MFHLEDFHVYAETGPLLAFPELPLSISSVKTVPASFSASTLRVSTRLGHRPAVRLLGIPWRTCQACRLPGGKTWISDSSSNSPDSFNIFENFSFSKNLSSKFSNLFMITHFS